MNAIVTLNNDFTNCKVSICVNSQAEGNAKFALDLYKHIEAEKGDSNAFFSPASISVALAMTYLGARSNTSAEMKNTMALTSLEDTHLHAAFNDLHTAVTNTGGNYTMHVANRMFIEQKYQLLKEFLDNTKQHYNAEATSVDFQTKHEEARKTINVWVEKQTNEKIKDLMPRGNTCYLCFTDTAIQFGIGSVLKSQPLQRL